MSPGTGLSLTIHTHLFHWHHTRPLTHLPKPQPEDARKTLFQKQPPEEAAWDELGLVPPHHEDDGDNTMSLRGGLLLSCLGLFHPSKLVDTTLTETCRLITGCIRPTATPDLYVLSGIAPPEIRRSVHSQNERTKQLTDQQHSPHHHQPVKSRLDSRNSFVSTSQPLLCKPTEARVAKWQEQWEATESNPKSYDVHPEKQLPSGHTLQWRTWRTANRVRSGQAATPAAKHLWGYRESETCVCGAATCDLGHITTHCRHFGEIPNRDEIAGMED